MKNNLSLVCVQDKKSGKWTCFLKELRGFTVQVNHPTDAPEKIGKAIEAYLMYGFEEKSHSCYAHDDPSNPFNKYKQQ